MDLDDDLEPDTGAEFISVDHRVMLGKPCIRGTRITVELLLEKMGYGVTIEDLLLDYPHITRDQILAGMRFAAAELRAHALAAYAATAEPAATR